MLHAFVIPLMAAALSAAPAAAPAAPAAPQSVTSPGRNFDEPPAGSADEQALWRRAYETNNRMVVDRTVATRLQLRAKQLTERVKALGGSGELAPDRAKALEADVLEAWNANLAVIQQPWPIDPIRACRYPWLHLDSAMQIGAAKEREEEVADTRKALEACLRRADAVLAKLGQSNRHLEHEVAEAEAALARLGPAAVAPAAAPTPAAAAPLAVPTR